MENERRQETTEPTDWTIRLWAGLLACLVMIWVTWGILALFYGRDTRREGRLVKTSQGSEKLVWKRPNYRHFQTFAQAVKEAQRLKRPIFLDLYADWCVPCKKLERETFSHPTVHPLLSRYLAVKFNVDRREGKRLAWRFRVRYYPTTLMLNSDGREIERVVGFYPPRYYRPALKTVLDGRGYYRDLLRRVRQNPRDLALKLQLAARSILRRRIADARRLYREVLREDPNNKRGFGAEALFGLARSFARVSQYRAARPYLLRYRKQFPQKNEILREVMRLQIATARRLRRWSEMKRVTALFREMFPGEDPKFK